MAYGAIPQVANEPKSEPITEPKAPVQANEPAETVANEATINTSDLMQRITQVEANNPSKLTDEDINNKVFSDTELRDKIDSITDSELKEQFTLMRKSMITGLNSKFEDLASLRKEIESIKSSSSKARFSANSVEELLNNQEFIEEAKKVSGQDFDEDDSLSDAAKQQIADLKKQLNTLTQGMTEREQQEAAQKWNAEHQRLSQVYKNYDQSLIDKTAQDLANNKINVTPEYLYKVLHHDENVQRAYELGRKEMLQVNHERKQASDQLNPVNAVKNGDLVQDKEESNIGFLQRIIGQKIAAGSPT